MYDNGGALMCCMITAGINMCGQGVERTFMMMMDIVVDAVIVRWGPHGDMGLAQLVTGINFAVEWKLHEEESYFFPGCIALLSVS